MSVTDTLPANSEPGCGQRLVEPSPRRLSEHAHES